MSATSRPMPLDGVRVLDLGQFIAMPFCALWLAWLGAEVIVVESRRRMTSRTAPPFKPGLEGNPDGSGYFNQICSSKKSCTLDMTTAAGRDIVRRLAGKVDVMVDNFSTGVLEKLGLGYDTIGKLNPGIVMVSCGAFGRSGPMKHSRGLHSAVNLFSGVADVTGYLDGEPRILGGVLPDPLSGTYGMFAIMAALHHRNRTGQGQFIDLAMYEAMMTLIPEAVIDVTLNDTDPKRTGNRDKLKAPHGIYPCLETDTWIAISVDSDEEWRSLCRVSGHGEWLNDPRFASAEGRVTHVGVLDAAVEGWTRQASMSGMVDKLQAAGVSAGPVVRCDQLLDDPQLQAHGSVVTIDHPTAGPHRQLGLPWQMDSLSVQYNRAPLLGEHTHDILTGLLGIDEVEYQRLEAGGVLS